MPVVGARSSVLGRVPRQSPGPMGKDAAACRLCALWGQEGAAAGMPRVSVLELVPSPRTWRWEHRGPGRDTTRPQRPGRDSGQLRFHSLLEAGPCARPCGGPGAVPPGLASLRADHVPSLRRNLPEPREQSRYRRTAAGAPRLMNASGESVSAELTTLPVKPRRSSLGLTLALLP